MWSRTRWCGRGVVGVCFFFFKEKTAYEMARGLVGSEMGIRSRENETQLGRKGGGSLRVRV